jgi:aspartate dehydrogenase
VQGDTVRIGLIGYGAIGAEVGASLDRLGERARLAAVLVRTGRLAGPFVTSHDATALLAARPDVVLEAAGHGAVAAYGPQILAAGVDLVITSTGVLADPVVAAHLQAAEGGGGRLMIAPGAVAGLDGLIAARLAGLSAVTYTSVKPPHAWRGTAAEAAVDLDDPAEELIIFEGSAREAALAFPKNANVAVSVGLCGLGLDRTRARLVSSRKVSDPLGLIEAEGAFGHFRFEIFARAARDNPKTSLLTAHSLLQCARLGLGIPVFPLLNVRTSVDEVA